jgi:hypothetical protein
LNIPFEGTYLFENNTFTLAVGPGVPKIVKYYGNGDNGLDVIQ